jgi:hypothetical protein
MRFHRMSSPEYMSTKCLKVKCLIEAVGEIYLEVEKRVKSQLVTGRRDGDVASE